MSSRTLTGTDRSSNAVLVVQSLVDVVINIFSETRIHTPASPIVVMGTPPARGRTEVHGCPPKHREGFFSETGLPVYLSAGNQFPRRPFFHTMKAAGWSLEATVVDRDLTVTQVNNCEHLERQVGLDKQFTKSRKQL